MKKKTFTKWIPSDEARFYGDNFISRIEQDVFNQSQYCDTKEECSDMIDGYCYAPTKAHSVKFKIEIKVTRVN